ncbi:MAG: type II secretion system protein [Trichodesmium sp. St5_bin8]|nr:type II secretion system protein [Trichodesmium sp. St5_bin8]
MKHLNLFKTLLRNQPKTSTIGFTIIELIFVVLIIGILSTIALPGWNAFINRQRTRTVNNGVLQALRAAQSDAKSTKVKKRLQFRYELNSDDDPPRFAIYHPDDKDPLWTSLGAIGEIKPGMVKLSVKECETKDDDGNCKAYKDDEDRVIQFDNLGAVEVDDQELPFAVSVSTAKEDAFKRCVIIETILGSMRIEEGEFNSSKGEGCP